MKTLEFWVQIITAVNKPISLSALALLVLALVLKMALSKVKPVKNVLAYKIIIYSISVIGIISFITVICTFAFSFYKVYIENEKNQNELSRLEAEVIIQKNRGNIERCISVKEDFYVLDFVFRHDKDAGITIDIFSNHNLWDELEPEEDPAHPGMIVYYEMLAKSGVNKVKLGVQYPDINKCLIETLKDEVNNHVLKTDSGFVHRYITKNGLPIFNHYNEHLSNYGVLNDIKYSTYKSKIPERNKQITNH